MPHQCVRCSTLYSDGASELLKGCSCGAKLFFYIRKDVLEKKTEAPINISKKERKRIERDVHEIIGEKKQDEIPVILDIESISIKKAGQYELDVFRLFNQDHPLVHPSSP